MIVSKYTKCEKKNTWYRVLDLFSYWWPSPGGIQSANSFISREWNIIESMITKQRLFINICQSYAQHLWNNINGEMTPTFTSRRGRPSSSTSSTKWGEGADTEGSVFIVEVEIVDLNIYINNLWYEDSSIISIQYRFFLFVASKSGDLFSFKLGLFSTFIYHCHVISPNPTRRCR